MNSSLRFAVTMLRMNGGLLIWGLHFGLVYGVNGIVCARELADVQWFGLGIMTWVVVAATVVALAATLVLIGHALRAGGGGGGGAPTPPPPPPHRRLVYASSADRQRERLAVDVLVKAVSIGTLIWLQRRGCTALEHVEAVDVVGLPDVDAWPDVTVVGPAHVAEE
jgi:hypothetical protein